MPRGYLCDGCEDFYADDENSTTVEFGFVVKDGTEVGDCSKILCPDCGQDVYDGITGDEAVAEALQ